MRCIVLATTCPADYTKLTFDGKEGCFNYGADAKSWADAETYCTGKSGGNLAVISSEAEMTAIKTWLVSNSKENLI